MDRIVVLTILVALYGRSRGIPPEGKPQSMDKSIHGKIYPWTSICQEAVYCNLVKIDVLKVSKEAKQEEIADLVEDANEIVDSYLSIDLNFRELKAYLDTLYDSTNDIFSNDVINNGIQYELRKYGVELMNKTSREEMYQSDGINIDQTPVRYIYSEACTEKLTECESSIQQLSNGLLPAELQACPWQSYPYNWFRCKSIESWPANLKSRLSVWQNNCELLPECELFEEWESFTKDGQAALPADWETRKSKSQLPEASEENAPENRRSFSLFILHPEVEKKLRESGKPMFFKNAMEAGYVKRADKPRTSRLLNITEVTPSHGTNNTEGDVVKPIPRSPEEVDIAANNTAVTTSNNTTQVIPAQQLPLKDEINQNQDQILQQIGLINPLQANYSNWLTCESQSTYFHEFRLYETIHGLAGVELNCRKHKSVYRHTAGKIVTDKSRTIQKPMLSCNDNSLLVGLNLIYLKYTTWSYYIHTVQGVCQSDTHTEYNLPKILEPPADELLSKPLRCPDGQALCGIRLNFQKPFLYNYERVYDIQLYCCDIELVCRKIRKLAMVEFFEYDNFKQGTTQVKFTEPVGYEFKDNRTSFIKPNMVEKTIKKIYPKNVGRKPENWTEPNFANERFQPVRYEEHEHGLSEPFVYKFYKQVLLCDNLVYYFNTGHKVVKELSAKHCKPRIIEQYMADYIYVQNYIDNVTIGVDYKTERGGNLTDFSATINGLEQNFRSHNLFIEKKFFTPVTKNTHIKLEAVAYFVSQTIGVCISDTEAFYVFTDNLTRHFEPNYCSTGRDWITLMYEFENEEAPEGIDISYELDIGLWWREKPANIKYPRGMTNSRLDLFNLYLGWQSSYTQVHGWNETNRRNYLTGVYKKTYKVKVPFMRKIQVFQVLGKCTPYYFMTGFKYFRMFDFDGICLGGFSDGPNTFGCEQETIPWLKLLSMM